MLPNLIKLAIISNLVLGLISTPVCVTAQTGVRNLRIKVASSPGIKPPLKGRMLIYVSRTATPAPKDAVDAYDMPHSGNMFGKDVTWNGKDLSLIIDTSTIGFPLKLASLPDTGKYFAQVVFDADTMSFSIEAPGNFYSDVVSFDASQGFVKLSLSKRFEAVVLPYNRLLKHVRIQSKLLSDFWKKPVFLDAGVWLPSDYDSLGSKRYPVRYAVGGYASRWYRMGWVAGDKANQKMWMDSAGPKMIGVFLDSDAPFGDSYQMNSANNGPYNDALITELIPFIEKTYHAMGTPESRFVDGGSTGGWVSLALQIFNPDFFNGCWSGYADPVDFHFFQLVNIYGDKNAFVNRYGNENPSARTIHGEPMMTIRSEVLNENVLGRGNSFTSSGGQWGAWNAVYSPRGADGQPMPIWDPRTGVIDTVVAEYWKRWDLKIYLEKNWATLGPKLQGKIHIWMGDMDNYYLNEAMRLLQQYLDSTSNPRSDAELKFGVQKGHGWEPLTTEQKMREMLKRMDGKKGF